jgi:anti-sigma regulatory factor (Ser/Thr protein kinase)
LGKRINIYIDFTKYVSHIELIKDLSPLFYAQQDDEVFITINLASYSVLYSDMLALVVGATVNLRSKSIQVNGEFLPFSNRGQANYASRIDFFRWLGFNYQEDFVRRSAVGKFTEIRKFISEKDTPENIDLLHTEIIRILYNSSEISKEMMQVLDFCLYEVLDNTLLHSKSGNGWACCQYFSKRREIRLIVLDTGIGIHKALTEYPGSKYPDLTENEAVARCIEKGVTSGNGMGFGLWATSQFIRENGGEMLIYSGNHFLNCHVKEPKVQQGALWGGTMTFLRINTDVPVDHKVIFGKNSTRDDDYDWFVEEKLGVSENLW